MQIAAPSLLYPLLVSCRQCSNLSCMPPLLLIMHVSMGEQESHAVPWSSHAGKGMYSRLLFYSCIQSASLFTWIDVALSVCNYFGIPTSVRIRTRFPSGHSRVCVSQGPVSRMHSSTAAIFPRVVCTRTECCKVCHKPHL